MVIAYAVEIWLRGMRRRGFALISALLLASPFTAVAEAPVLDITGMIFVASRGSTNEIVLRAEYAHMRSDSDLVQMRNVSTTVSSRDNRPGFEMTCERGELNLQTSDFYAEGHVRGKTHSGQHFETEWVRYDHVEEVLFTDAPVTITEGVSRYRGGGFRYLVSERRFRLLGGASVVQKP